MDFELVVVQGRSATSTIKLGDGVTTIGRHDTCQLRIKSSQVSRKHCELFEKKGLLLVKDLKSSNGTIVNGKRIQEQCVLEPGDELTIGPIQLRVAKAGTSAAAAAKPGGGAGDTAVTEAIAVADEAEHDDFTLDLDATTQASPTVAVAPSAPAPQKASPKAKAAPPPEDDAFADFLVDMPDDDDQGDSMSTTAHIPVAAPPKADPKTQAAKPKPEPAQEKAAVKEVEKEPAGSDDAIADFLLDIKLDEEE